MLAVRFRLMITIGKTACSPWCYDKCLFMRYSFKVRAPGVHLSRRFAHNQSKMSWTVLLMALLASIQLDVGVTQTIPCKFMMTLRADRVTLLIHFVVQSMDMCWGAAGHKWKCEVVNCVTNYSASKLAIKCLNQFFAPWLCLNVVSSSSRFFVVFTS